MSQPSEPPSPDIEVLEVLLIEDEPGDATLIQHALSAAEGFRVNLTCVERLSTGIARLAKGPVDTILLDLSLPDSQGLDTLRAVHDRAQGVPIVVITGFSDEAVAIEAIQQGAQDYLLKDEADGEALGRSIRHAIARTLAEKRYRDLVQNANSIILRLDPSGKITLFNEFAQRLFGYTEEEMIGRPLVGTIVPRSTGGDLSAMVEGIGQRPQWYATTESECIAQGGLQVWVAWTNRAILDDKGQVREILCVGNDISPRKQTERELEALVQLHETTLATMPSSVLVLDRGLTVLMANRRYFEMQNAQDDEVMGHNIADVLPHELLAEQSLLEHIRTVARDGGQHELPAVHYALKDRYLHFRICAIPLQEGATAEPRVLLVFEDVTDRMALEEHVRQTSRLDSIGRLAGGIAHDFNNMLTALTGYSELLLAGGGDAHPTQADIVAMRRAGERVAHLTRQLLAFSRRQPMQLVTLDLNQLIVDAADTLQRLVGEDIELEWDAAPESLYVRADPAQIEQVLMSLAVNAREAMPDGGALTIETASELPDEPSLDSNDTGPPGKYVLLAVTDTGWGIDATIREYVFEPFFTTKEAGKGHGLGLATVYGIVKQHEGQVSVHGEPGRGTTFKILLPRADDSAGTEPSEGRPKGLSTAAPAGIGTILVVEDEEVVLSVVQRVLEAKGYTVLAAARPNEAEALFAQKCDEIALLLADVVMPGCSGPDLHRRLVERCPSLKVLYMSGHEEVTVHRDGIVPVGSPFIRKPFDPDQLTEMVREVLGQ